MKRFNFILLFIIFSFSISYAEEIEFAGVKLNLLCDSDIKILNSVDKEDYYLKKQWNEEIINFSIMDNFSFFDFDNIVAVIDSGLYYEHPNLDRTKIYEGVCYDSGSVLKDTCDSIGHGTKVVGVLSRLNPFSKILPIHVIDDEGNTSVNNTIKAIKDVIEYNSKDENTCKIRVINISLGSSEYSYNYEKVLKEARDSGIIVICSVGNKNKYKNIKYPASYDGVISVGSVDKNCSISNFSKSGNNIFVVAPGEEILSLNDPLHSNLKGSIYDDNISGTSISAPHVSALASVLVSIDSSIDLNEFKDILAKTCTDLGDKGYDNEYGYGLINFDKALWYVVCKNEKSLDFIFYSLYVKFVDLFGGAVC